MSGQQIATSQFSSFIARTRKKLSDWRTKSFGTTSASLKRAFSFYGLLIALILSAMALIAYETFRSPSVVFDPISVPQRLNELGHTSQTVVNRLREEIEVPTPILDAQDRNRKPRTSPFQCRYRYRANGNFH